MEDLTLRYYDAEMRYLREAAKEFAQAHPDRAAMLDLDKAGIGGLYDAYSDVSRLPIIWLCAKNHFSQYRHHTNPI